MGESSTCDAAERRMLVAATAVGWFGAILAIAVARAVFEL
jgi:hypothetical protein